MVVYGTWYDERVGKWRYMVRGTMHKKVGKWWYMVRGTMHE